MDTIIMHIAEHNMKMAERDLQLQVQAMQQGAPGGGPPMGGGDPSKPPADENRGEQNVARRARGKLPGGTALASA